MTSPLSRALLTTLIVLSLVAATNLRPSPAAEPAGVPRVLGAAGLEAEKTQGEALVNRLHLSEALGPLAPVALSPFFALTCLSGASLLADSVPMLSGIANNPMLSKGSTLHNPFVFAGLLLLSLITAAPKLTKVTKPLAQAVDQIEAHAGIIAVVAVQFLSQMRLGEAEPRTAELVVQAGLFSFSWSVLLAAMSALNIFVINTVKFFFEVLIWLSPFPAVDATFEAANKAVAAFLLGIYVTSPKIAVVLDLLIFAVSLLIFAWAHRRVVYMRSVLADPILGWLAERVFRRPHVTLTSTSLPPAAKAAVRDCTVVLKAFTGRATPGLARKSRGFLIRADDRWHFVRPRWFRAPRTVDLSAGCRQVELKRGLLSNTVVFHDAGGESGMTVIFTRRYNAVLDALRAQLGETVEAPAPAAAETRRPLAVARSVGAAVKAGPARDELRAELA